MKAQYDLLILKALKTPPESDSIVEQKLMKRINELENVLEDVLVDCISFSEIRDILNKEIN